MIARSTLLVALLALGALTGAATSLQAQNVHLGHVLDGFPGAPEGQALLDVAEAEAATAAQHAQLAYNDNTNLPWMQRHALHVLHAVDPSRIEEGPGTGYGVVQAAEGIQQHAALAAEADGASQAVRTHAVHVQAAAASVAERAENIADLAERVGEASDYTTAGSLIEQISFLARGLTSGVDVDGDGEITWQGDEGGLEQARRHAELMAGS